MANVVTVEGAGTAGGVTTAAVERVFCVKLPIKLRAGANTL